MLAALPGGIQDFWTNRPRTTKRNAWNTHLSTSVRPLRWRSRPRRAQAPMVRVASIGAADRAGDVLRAGRVPEQCRQWRHSAAASTLFSVDYLQTHATAAPGIPEYREATGQKIVGPYTPLAGFNALGPEAGVRRRSMVANVILDAQPHPKIAVRAGVEAWWRRIEQDRFTTGLLNLSTGRFEGTREPRHSEQPQSALVARAEATARFAALRGEHKLMLATSHTTSDYLREERALSTACAMRCRQRAAFRSAAPISSPPV